MWEPTSPISLAMTFACHRIACMRILKVTITLHTTILSKCLSIALFLTFVSSPSGATRALAFVWNKNEINYIYLLN